jgi:heme/copper-type cytochrome/quinol oxidase subunit 3
MAQGVAASANPHGSAFYVFIGLHGTHLAGGIWWLSRLWITARQLETENEIRRHRIAVGAAAMYWHFMAALWLALFFFLRRWTL